MLVYFLCFCLLSILFFIANGTHLKAAGAGVLDSYCLLSPCYIYLRHL